MICGLVESVTFIKHLDNGVDLCKVTIDFDTHYIFDQYNNLLNFINKYVEYSTRQDVIDGMPATVINHMVDQFTVNTVAKQDGVKLIPENCDRAVCNFDISTLRFGDYEIGVIALLTGYEVSSSKKTKWIDCDMVDKLSHHFNLRIFIKSVEGDEDPCEVIESLVGHYVKFNVNYTKYGYQTDEVELVNRVVTVAPEVDIALSVINEVLSTDSELQEYVVMHNLLNTLKGRLDGDLGYELVYMAAELEMINAISNISDAYDVKVLRRAVLCSRGYKLTAGMKYSKSILNVNKVLKTLLKTDKHLISILDPMSEENVTATKRLYYKIRTFARIAVDERRNLDEKIMDDVDCADIYAKFGGML